MMVMIQNTRIRKEEATEVLPFFGAICIALCGGPIARFQLTSGKINVQSEMP